MRRAKWSRLAVGERRFLIEARAGEAISPISEARALAATLHREPGLTQAALARRIDRSAPYVSNMLRQLRLDPAVLDAIDSGTLTSSHGKALVALPHSLQRQLATLLTVEGWSAHRLEREIVGIRGRKRQRRQSARE